MISPALSAGGEESSIDRAPLVIRDEVIFPYREGALFAISLWRSGGFDNVNRAFANPPRSTEQIIHPEKYVAADQPAQVKALSRRLQEWRASVGSRFTPGQTPLSPEHRQRLESLGYLQ